MGMYVGVDLVIVAGAAWAVWAIVGKKASDALRPFLPAFAVQSGLLVSFLVAALLQGRQGFEMVAFDIALMIPGLAWLYLRPGAGPIAVLTTYQSVALLLNLVVFATEAVGSAAHKGVVLVIIVRAVAIYLMMSSLSTARRTAAAAI